MASAAADAFFSCGENKSRRPTERPAAQQVDVQMVHGLAAIRPVVYHHAIALGEHLGAGNLRRNPQQVTEQWTVAFCSFGQRDDVFARRNEHMHRRRRMNVRKGVSKLILEHSGRGNASFNDLAKQATHSDTSVQDVVSLR
jgi:hypothetical protein